MVQKGQFLERPALIPTGGEVVLEGLCHRGDRRPPLLIVPPLPDEGGSMDHVIAAEIAWAAASAGHPTLRFNFRGVGASQGVRGDRPEIDVECARRLLEENTGTPSWVCLALGGSATLALALAENHPATAGLCLVSPTRIRPSDLERVEVPLLVVVGAKDSRLPKVAWTAAVAELGGALEVVEEADHAFTRNLPEVGRRVTLFLRRLSAQTQSSAGSFVDPMCKEEP
jgi:uncharacterized protein